MNKKIILASSSRVRQKILSNAGISFGQPVCMYDDAQLPLGDRLASVVLGLLNDNILRTQYEQIHYAIIRHEQRERHINRNRFLDLFP